MKYKVIRAEEMRDFPQGFDFHLADYPLSGHVELVRVGEVCTEARFFGNKRIINIDNSEEAVVNTEKYTEALEAIRK